jgi:hypothetical protein
LQLTRLGKFSGRTESEMHGGRGERLIWLDLSTQQADTPTRSFA